MKWPSFPCLQHKAMLRKWYALMTVPLTVFNTLQIMSARKIREAVNAVIASAKLIADECTDPRLKADVLNYAQAITSFSTQLKIITSVKSAEETVRLHSTSSHSILTPTPDEPSH
jgi:hypothetical protein